MLEPVVITLSVIAAVTCLAIYVVRNRDLRDYVSGRSNIDDGFPDDCTADGECRYALTREA